MTLISTISLDFALILHFLLISSKVWRQLLPPLNITDLDYSPPLLKTETIHHYHLQMANHHPIQQTQLSYYLISIDSS